MQRDHWSFEYTAAALEKAARAKVDFHAGRLTFWRSAKEATMKEVREAGIEVDEGVDVGAQYHSNTTRLQGPRVMVRTDLQGKLTECAGKIREHADKVTEYDGWVQVLAADPGKRLSLHSDDYLFFFGK